jgi:hypothetical protein
MRTKRIFVLQFALLICSLLTAVLTPAQNPPPPARDYFPDTWSEFVSKSGRFRIKSPKPLIETVSKQQQYDVYTFVFKGLLEYQVAYVDFNTPIDNPQKVDQLLQSVKATALSAVGDKNVQLVSERKVNVDGYQGLFVHFENQGKEVVRIEWIAAGSRLYTIGTTSRKGSPTEMEGKDDFEKVSLGFINPFHFIREKTPTQ